MSEIILHTEYFRKEFWNKDDDSKRRDEAQEHIASLKFGKFDLYEVKFSDGEEIRMVEFDQTFGLVLEGFRSRKVNDDGMTREHAWIVCDYRLVPREGEFVELVNWVGA